MHNTIRNFTSVILLIGTSLTTAATAQDHDGMKHGSMKAEGQTCTQPMGEGVINQINVTRSQVNITHKPIAAIEWPEMTMNFDTDRAVDLAAFAPNENVHFMLQADKKGDYTIAAMCSLDVVADAHEACMTAMHKVTMKIAAESGQSCIMGEESHDGHSSMDGSPAPTKNNHSGHH